MTKVIFVTWGTILGSSLMYGVIMGIVPKMEVGIIQQIIVITQQQILIIPRPITIKMYTMKKKMVSSIVGMT